MLYLLIAGEVRYETHTDGPVLANVSAVVSQQQGLDFQGTWMLVAEWKDAPWYPIPSKVSLQLVAQGVLKSQM